ncbi:response regulator transcription factor [Priestia filamentosa]|uniref:response regulator transcription factor n=1 Tax=Priestia filamentosa TaxID=1402861 RepID=UPI000A08DF3F|nr:response regulator transcription factor [Priestia filamentosa]MDT3763543.1 response regulator transcription factor [Priestia filamentosa]OXS71960.1 DNA-binding response regulator [Priestia filamentosa]WRU93980.1 response regulator transcription factor [Priestia filamentosa]SMF16439.1 DNA-binding response regulator, OmpR family, contains REC and winged-helix (wHTH) domain [Priestia filamentosa]
MPIILLVDDELRMLDLLELYLTPNGFTCIKFDSGTEALNYIEEGNKADLMLLDIMMPEKDGWEICREIRNSSKVPIIMLTARDQTVDIIKGLNMGADDYIVKPFSEGELIARIRAVLRRASTENEEINYKGLLWSREHHLLKYKNASIQVTPKEFELVGLLLQYPNRVFSREDLLTLVWGYDTEIEGRTIDSHVRNVRDKLRRAEFPVDEHLQTVWGLGYKWVDNK